MNSTRIRTISIVTINFAIFLGLFTAFNNCSDSTQINDKDASAMSAGDVLQLTAATYQVQTGNSVQLSVINGEPPYTFTVTPQSGGSVDANLNFVANQPGATGIEVIDNKGHHTQIAINVENPPPPPGTAPTPLPCAAPGGGTIASGQSITAYLNSMSLNCPSEIRYCTNGVLSGSYNYKSCTLRDRK